MSKILRVGQFGRTFTRGMAEYIKTVEGRQHPVSNDTVKIFKLITYFVGIPLLGVSMVNCYIKVLEENHEPAPEFIQYPYMKIMNKAFPWKDGKHSLFHNPKKNYIPGIGYEEN